MILFPNAKINLGLNIINRRLDGYHNLESLFLPIDWKDVLEIIPTCKERTTLTVYGRQPACDINDNLVMKAYRALNEVAPIPPVDIYLEKIIPNGAGLGGGSSDAAFTLKGLNSMFQLGLNDCELASIAGRLGADCAFFIYNRPMLASGIGTELTDFKLDAGEIYIVVVKPDVSVSTREAYSGVSPMPWPVSIAELLKSHRLPEIKNDFETSIFPSHPELAKLKAEFYSNGAFYASMTGSGSSIYGLFRTPETAEAAYDALKSCGIAHWSKL